MKPLKRYARPSRTVLLCAGSLALATAGCANDYNTSSGGDASAGADVTGDSAMGGDSPGTKDAPVPIMDSTTDSTAADSTAGDSTAADSTSDAPTGDAASDGAAPTDALAEGATEAGCDPGSLTYEAAAPVARCPTDPCTIATMRAAFTAPLVAAQVALVKGNATNPSVIAFATQLQASYTFYNKNLSTNEAAQSAQEQACPLSDAMNALSGQTLSALQAAAGAPSFDQVYVQSQVVLLQAIKDRINSDLYGCAGNPWKALLRFDRKRTDDAGAPAGIVADLQSATTLLSTITDAGSPTDAGGGG
jgi:predicted outer membrane protein